MGNTELPTFHKLVIGSSEIMKEVEDSTIQTIITSPPYWDIKDYGDCNQIGLNDSYNSYLDKLVAVFKECNRVLKSDGSMWINIDTINTGHDELVTIPFDLIPRLRALGLLLRDIMIWHNPIAFPENVSYKLANKFEYVLFLTKNPRSFKFYKDTIREPHVTTNDKRRWRYNPKGRDPGNVWTINRIVYGEKEFCDHPAPFPSELPRRIIKLTSDPGDTILDPFVGSGTTMMVARELRRNSIGYELNPQYFEMIKDRLTRMPGSKINTTEKRFLDKFVRGPDEPKPDLYDYQDDIFEVVSRNEARIDFGTYTLGFEQKQMPGQR
jgi:site-specific DNA-methyltransferase (adenine-specific)